MSDRELVSRAYFVPVRRYLDCGRPGTATRSGARVSLAAAALAVAAAAGCGSGTSAQDDYIESRTGLNLATFDASCAGGPSEQGREPPPCGYRQAHAAFRLERVDGSAPKRYIGTSRQGRAFLNLAPGEYRITPFTRYLRGRPLGPPPDPFDVVVEANRRTPVIIDYFQLAPD